MSRQRQIGAWRWLLLASALLLWLVGTQPTLAQEEGTQIETLTVTLMPQYDDRRLLVLYEAQLAEPGEVLFGVPSGVELHAAAYRASDGTLRNAEARFDAASDGRFVRFMSPTREARLELYHDVVPRGPERVVEWALPSQRRDIPMFVWRAVFPLEASELESDPAMSPTGANHLGMLTYERVVGALPAREGAVQRIEWTRASDEPSIVLPDEEPLSNAEPGRNWSLYIGGGLLFLLGLLLVGDGIRKQRRAK